MKPRVAIIVPCYNEEAVLPASDMALRNLLRKLECDGMTDGSSFVLYVDDGSNDSTWDVISSLSGHKSRGVRLSRHCGHQEALLAGLETALQDADALLTIDADMQDDINVIPEMIRKFTGGADIVFGVRRNRDSDSWLKKTTAKTFYSAMKALGASTISDHADFRLMSARAVADLLEFKERNLFLRGMVPTLGYRQEKVYYERKNRIAGESKYPFCKMLDFAVNGITSFSVRPVRMVFFLGLAFILTAFGIFIYVLIRHFSGETIEGWTSLMLSIWFCTGILLIAMGIIGEYIGKIYIEVKQRPRYRISECTHISDKEPARKRRSDKLQEVELVADLHSGK